MTILDIFLTQIVDPFRIGLIIALMFTALRTQSVTGTIMPLLLGIVFVAVIIPSTMQTPGEGGLLMAVLVGLGTNAVLLALVMAARSLFLRFRG